MVAENTLFAFSSASSVESWRSVDDQVMGGVSSSAMVFAEQHASFIGDVSPENNGGFASVRSVVGNALPQELDHIWIESRGDGKLYSLLIGTNKTSSGISYQADFRSLSTFARIEIPLVEFKAQFRGRAVVDAPELSAADIEQIGIMISDRQYGAFKLDVKAIGAIDLAIR